jgi:hypothetical protein
MDLYRKLLVLLLIPISVMGQTGSINVDQNHNGHRIYGLPTPTAGNEAATKAYADSVGGGGGGSVSLTATSPVVVTPSPITGTGVISLSGTSYGFGFLPLVDASAARTYIGALSLASIDNTAFSSSWAGFTTIAPSKKAVYDELHLFDTDDDGKVNVLDMGAGMVRTDAAGVVSAATAGVEYLPPTAISDVAFASSWDTVTQQAPSRNAVYDWGHTFDTDDDGKVNVLDLAAGIPKTNASGVLSLAVAGTDYEPPLGNPGTDGYVLSSTTAGVRSWIAPGGGGGTGANPTAKVGTSVVNGSASTFMRSDAAPPIDQTVNLAMTAAQSITISDAVTNTIVTGLTLGHNSSATPIAGFGTGIIFNAKDSTTADSAAGKITVDWTTPGHGANVSEMIFSGVSGGVGAYANPMTLRGNGVLNVITGFTISSQATSGKVMQGDGIKFTESAPAWPTGAGTAGKLVQSDGSNFVTSTPTWPTTAGTSSYSVRSDGTNYAAYPMQIINSSTADDSSFAATDRYVAGSACTVAAGDFKAGGQYRCIFDMVKSAGTGAIVITVRVGTTGTTSDTTATIPFTFGAGTSVADTGMFEVLVNFRSVGSGTSAVIAGVCRGTHNLATTGLFNNAAAWTIIGTTSAGFNSSTATKIGVSFNGSTSFAGVNKVVQAALQQ